MNSILNNTINTNATHIALKNESNEINYSEYVYKINKVSSYISKLNLPLNSRICIISENNIDFAPIFFGIINSGHIAAPINYRLTEFQISERIDVIGAEIIILSSHLKDKFDNLGKDKIEFDEILENNYCEQENHNNELFKLDIDQPASIIFTSGTSGKPKAIVHTLNNHIESALASNEIIKFESGDIWNANIPFFHVGGIAILFRALICGGTVSCYDGIEDMITHMSLVPLQLSRMLKDKKDANKLLKLKAILLGGDSVNINLLQSIKELNLNAYISYGSTELGSQIATKIVSDIKDIRNPSAKILGHCEVKISDNKEILIKGKSLSIGEWINSEIIPITNNDGWFNSNDIGILDENNELRVIGRIDNMFISGGENIQPEIIENAICEIDSIQKAIVVPVKDEEYGKKPVAFIKFSEQNEIEITSEYITEFLKSKLSGLMVPVMFRYLKDDYLENGLKYNRSSLTNIAEISSISDF